MKRLLKKSFRHFYEIGEKVRILNENQKGFYSITNVDLRSNTYEISNDVEVIEDVNFYNLVSEDEFIVGDKVLFKRHPYDDTIVFEVKEVLADGTYFIESPSKAFTNINGINLELIM